MYRQVLLIQDLFYVRDEVIPFRVYFTYESLEMISHLIWDLSCYIYIVEASNILFLSHVSDIWQGASLVKQYASVEFRTQIN